MTHENLLNDVRDALGELITMTTYHVYNDTTMEAEQALNRLNAFLADVPDDLGMIVDTAKKTCWDQESDLGVITTKCARMLHTATTKGHDDE